MAGEIVVVGSLNVDLVVRLPRMPAAGQTVPGDSFEQFSGGKGANQACAVARLGGRVRMVGQVGGDPQGTWLLAQLRRMGVLVDQVGIDGSTSTGVAVIALERDGANRIIVVPGANGTLQPQTLGGLESAGLLLLQLEIPMATVVRAATVARARGATVILDPAPAQPLGDDLLRACDFVTPNETELCLLSGRSPEAELPVDQAFTLAERLRARGPAHVIVKLGGRGAIGVGPQGARWTWPPFAVTVVDTTGAGDAWNGAFALALSEGSDVQAAGRFASAVAALKVTRAGAQTGLPERAEVETLLR